jgi:hypothetical protein
MKEVVAAKVTASKAFLTATDSRLGVSVIRLTVAKSGTEPSGTLML